MCLSPMYKYKIFMLTNNIIRNPRKDIMLQKKKKQNVSIDTDATRKLSQRINIQCTNLVCTMGMTNTH